MTAGTWTGPIRVEGATGADARGWYLYGITRGGSLAPALADADASHDGEAPLRLVEAAGLAAVVRPVPLADFTEAALQERLRSESALEAMVRRHNRVIEAVHARQAILPARFGTVYAGEHDIVSSLRSTGDALLRQLQRIEGCDEWALHVYADRAIVRECVAAKNPAVERLRAECAAARPGRAFFLERQLRDETEGAMREALLSLAQSILDRLVAVAAGAEVNAIGPVSGVGDEVEILRTALLVARDEAERLADAMRASADAASGLRFECTGPWAPYSFAVIDRGETV